MGGITERARAPLQLLLELQSLVSQLVARLQAPAPEPGLHLSPLDCRRLEDTTGFGSTLSPAVFLRAVERLAAIQVGEIRLPFTPGQLAELQHRAQKRGRSLEAEMKAAVARIEDELFYKGG